MIPANGQGEGREPSREWAYGHETQRERTDRIRKIKNIRKDKITAQRAIMAQRAQAQHQEQPISREQRKQVQKEKNRIAAQISRDKQKRHLEDLYSKIGALEKQLESKLCSKCKAQLSDHSTSEEEQSYGEMPLELHRHQYTNPLGLMGDEDSVEPLPYIRVPFEKSDLGFGKIGSFFCMTMLVLAIFCFSNAGGDQSFMTASEPTFGKGRIMQAVNFCDLALERECPSPSYPKYPIGHNQLSPSWASNQTSDSLCKNDFWESYLRKAQTELAIPQSSTGKNLINCESPSLLRITPMRRDELEPSRDQWTFLVSNPTVSHAHFEEFGELMVDDINYLDGLYEMVAENVVLKKVIGQNCLA